MVSTGALGKHHRSWKLCERISIQEFEVNCQQNVVRSRMRSQTDLNMVSTTPPLCDNYDGGGPMYCEGGASTEYLLLTLTYVAGWRNTLGDARPICSALFK